MMIKISIHFCSKTSPPSIVCICVHKDNVHLVLGQLLFAFINISI